jgi:hypothetical protein
LVEIPINSKKKEWLALACFVVAMASFLWLGAASLLSAFGNDKAAVALCPAFTDAMEKIIVAESDPQQAAVWADRALKNNPYVYDAYDVKAKAFAERGQWGDAAAMKKESLSISRLHGRNYDEFLMYIHFAIKQAAEEGDAELCARLAGMALDVPGALDALEGGLNEFAYCVAHQPTLELSAQSQELLEYLGKFQEQLRDSHQN